MADLDTHLLYLRTLNLRVTASVSSPVWPVSVDYILFLQFCLSLKCISLEMCQWLWKSFFPLFLLEWIQIRLLGCSFLVERDGCFHITVAVFASTDEPPCITELPSLCFHSRVKWSCTHKFSYLLFCNQDGCSIWVTFFVKLRSICHLFMTKKSPAVNRLVCSCGFWQGFQCDSRLSGT